MLVAKKEQKKKKLPRYKSRCDNGNTQKLSVEQERNMYINNECM